jgi:hypothetical protein
MFTDFFQINHHTKRPADKALNFIGTARPAYGGFSPAPGMGSTGQHAILSGNPALPPTLQKRRNFILNTYPAQDVGPSHLY